MNKKFSILLFFLIMCFSVSIVSADGNFTDLKIAIEKEVSNELLLQENYIFNEETDENLTNGIVISRDNFIINGNSHTINANQQSKIFNITGNNITLKNIILINAKANEENKDGAVIFNTGNLTILNSNFTNNEANIGAAIFNSAGTLTVENCEFINNVANHIANDIYNNDIAYIHYNNFNTTNNIPLVFNDVNGILSLEKNYMYSRNLQKINNHGLVISQVWVVVYSNYTFNGIYGEDTKLFATISDDFGNVVVGQNITLFNPILGTYSIDNINNEQYEIFFKPNATGSFQFVTIKYDGTNNLSSRPGILIVEKNNITLNIKYIDMFLDKNQSIIVSINPEATGDITYIHNNETITLPVLSGTVNFINLNLSIGNHNITFLYSGDENFNSLIIRVNLTVLENNKTDIIIEDITISVTKNQTLVINIFPDVTGNMTLIINGTDYIAEIINGTAMFPVEYLNPGNYTGTILYDGDDKYNGFNITINFYILKDDVLLNTSDIFMYYSDGTRYIVNLIDTLSNPIFNQTIYITVNGITYTRITDENGTVSMAINLLPKTYSIVAYYNGSSKYHNTTIITDITINSTIISSDLIKYYKNKTQYQITVLGADGNPLANQNIEFNVNGMKYLRVSDNNGIVTLSINLFPGNYTITSNYNGLSQSNNIEILSTIIGKNLTKNFGGVEQYEVTVLDGIGKPLTNQDVIININGVFYNRISDSDGIVRLNINLNPGSYIATATWNGYSTSNNITVIS